MTYREVLTKVREAGIRFTIGGSYPIRNLRTIRDIDVEVNPLDWTKLKALFPEGTETTYPDTAHLSFLVKTSDLEVSFANGSVLEQVPWYNIGDAVDHDEDGNPVITLGTFIKWKQTMGRKKDLEDLALLKKNTASTKLKAQVLEYVTKYFDRLDPSGYNSKRFRELVEPMTVAEFSELMLMIQKGEVQLRLIMPPLKSKMDMNAFLGVAKELEVPIFHKIQITDPATGVRYVTPEAYPILLLPIRRAQQTIEKKRSVAESDRFIDALSGQRTGDDVAAALSHPEIHVLSTRGLQTVLRELVQVRGGNISAYTEYKTQLEDAGAVTLDTLDPNSRTRISTMIDVLFACMHIKSNVVEV